MKKYLLTIAILLLGLTYAQAQSMQGVFVSPIFEISELEADVTLGMGFAVGTNVNNWHVAAYGLRTVRSGESGDIGSWHNLRLTSGGLWIAYQRPVSQYVSVNAGMKMGLGQITREWNILNELSGVDKANLTMLTPEIGVELALSDRVSIGYTSGFRWAMSMEHMPDFSTRDVNALSNTVTLKFALLGSIR